MYIAIPSFVTPLDDSQSPIGKHHLPRPFRAVLDKASRAAIFARPRMIPELLRMASGHNTLAARFKVAKSSPVILTFT